MDEIAVPIEATLQHDGVPMRIVPQKVAERLKAKQRSTFHSGFRSFVEIILDHTKDESTDFGEELSVMPEEHSQALGQTERHESVRKTKRKIILNVLGKEERSFLGTGRA